MNFSKTSLQNYLKLLGSSAPAPGGGSGAALVSATGVALAEMVAAINEKKPKAVGGRQNSKELKKIKNKLLSLVTKDAQVFEKIKKAFAKDRNSVEYQKALKMGAESPLEICEWCLKAAKLAVLEKERTSKWLISDLKESLILLEAGYRSARLNVEINLNAVTDHHFKNKTAAQLEKIGNALHEYQTSLAA